MTPWLLQNLPTIIWLAIAVWGARVVGRAIIRSSYLLSVARSSSITPLITVRLEGTLLLYRVRLALIANNLGLGLLALLAAVGWLLLPPVAYGIYAAASLTLNELAFVLLTYRDDRLLRRQLALAGLPDEAARRATTKEPRK